MASPVPGPQPSPSGTPRLSWMDGVLGIPKSARNPLPCLTGPCLLMHKQWR